MFDRLVFFFQIIEHDWRDLKLNDSFMLKLESAYRNNFPKDQDSGLRLPSKNSPPKVKKASIDITLTNSMGVT